MKRTVILILLIIQIFQVKAQTKDLNYFIQEGLVNSPLLKEYLNKEQQNKLDSISIVAKSGFQVMAESNNYYAPVIKGWGYDNAVTDGSNITAILSVSRELTGAKNKLKHFESIRLQNQSSKNEGKISEQELKKNIIDQYIITYSNEQQYIFNKEILNLLNNEVILLHQLTQSGLYKQTDYLSFCVNQGQQKILVNSLKNQYEYDYFTLCYLCGIQDNSVYSLSDPEIKTELLPDITSSVFMYQYELDSLKIQNAKDLVEYEYRPKVNAYADAGYLSSLSNKPGQNFGASIGLKVSVPIYDGGQKKIQYKLLSIDEQNRSNYVDFFKSQYQQKIKGLWKKLQTNNELTKQIIEQIAYVQALMEADHKLLESGDLRISEYLVAMGNFLNAKNMLIQNKIDKYQIINELNYWNRSK